MLSNFINEILNLINKNKEIIQNEYVFQHLFYFYGRKLTEEKKSHFYGWVLISEDELSVKVSNSLTGKESEPRPDFIILNGNQFYVVELKCKTKKDLLYKNGFPILVGANPNWKTKGKSGILEDIRRIAQIKNKSGIIGNYCFGDGYSVLLTNIEEYKNVLSNNITAEINMQNINGGNKMPPFICYLLR